MGQAQKVKGELRAAVEMVDLLQTLKDVASNKLYTLMNQKDKFRRFGESFVEFFRLISLTEVEHPLISNKCKTVGIVVVTVEGSFLGAFNNKIIRMAFEEKEKHEDVKFIGIGEKALAPLLREDPDLKTFSNMEGAGIYETAILVKDYLVEEVMQGRLGKVMVCYSWPKTMDTQQSRAIQLLPCEDLVLKQNQQVDVFEQVIEESQTKEIIGYLTNLWITTRLFEIFMDCILASAAALSKFLDDSVEKMKKERKKVTIKYRKAKKSDIDKSLRETFSARMMSEK